MQDSFELGEYAGNRYHLAIRGEPDLQSPDDFAVILYYKDAETESEFEVARIDTSHGHTHLDKLYLEEQESEPVDLDLWGAVQHMCNHFVEYARRYREKQ